MINEINRFLSVDTRGSRKFWIKGSNPPPIPRDPAMEYTGYQMLSPYLKMPKARYINSSTNLLVVANVEGESLETLIRHDPMKAAAAYTEFSQDMIAMWQSTATETDETSYTRNIREESLAMAGILLQTPEIEDVLGKKLVVNEREYPALVDTFTQVIHDLSTRKDPVMTYRHGDEQIGNIIATGDSYKTIDPSYPGYGSPAFVVNTAVIGNYVFYYDWEKEVEKTENSITVNYHSNGSTTAEAAFRKPFRMLQDAVDGLSDEPFLTREYMFVNFMRCAAGKVARPNQIDEVFTNGDVYLGLAQEAYYGHLLN